MKRRQFVKTALATLGVTAIGAPAAWFLRSAFEKPLRDVAGGSIPESDLAQLQVLTAKECELLRAISQALIPPSQGEGRLPSANQIRTAERIDVVLRSEDKASIDELKLLLVVFSAASYAYALPHGSVTGFAGLSLQTQQNYLKGYWEDSPFAAQRLGFWALKRVITVAYFSSDTVWAVLKYPGPYHPVSPSQLAPAADAIAISPLATPLSKADIFDNPLLEKDPLENS